MYHKKEYSVNVNNTQQQKQLMIVLYLICENSNSYLTQIPF